MGSKAPQPPPVQLLPCPFCGVTGRCGPDGAYYFAHDRGCWLELQQGVMLDCVSHEELDQWSARKQRPTSPPPPRKP